MEPALQLSASNIYSHASSGVASQHWEMLRTRRLLQHPVAAKVELLSSAAPDLQGKNPSCGNEPVSTGEPIVPEAGAAKSAAFRPTQFLQSHHEDELPEGSSAATLPCRTLQPTLPNGSAQPVTAFPRAGAETA